MATDLTGGLGDDREYVFAAQPDDPEMRESVNAWIWDSGNEVGMPRVGIEAVADQWDTHDIQLNIALPDGRVFNMLGPGAVHDPAGADGRPRILGAGPLSFEMVEPFGRWQMRIDGEVHATDVEAQIGGQFPGEGELVPITAEIDLHGAVPPWMNGALLPQDGLPNAILSRESTRVCRRGASARSRESRLKDDDGLSCSTRLFHRADERCAIA